VDLPLLMFPELPGTCLEEEREFKLEFVVLQAI
jgi:hypothetical protein